MASNGFLAHLGNVAAHSANRFIEIVAQPASDPAVYQRIAPPRQTISLPPLNQARYLPPPQPVKYQLRNREFYHGTNEDAALKVFYEAYWFFGNSTGPFAIWMTTNLATAQHYAGNAGRILVLYVYPDVELNDQGEGIYTLSVLFAEPNTEYEISDYVEPVALLDYKGNQLA